MSVSTPGFESNMSLGSGIRNFRKKNGRGGKKQKKGQNQKNQYADVELSSLVRLQLQTYLVVGILCVK